MRASPGAVCSPVSGQSVNKVPAAVHSIGISMTSSEPGPNRATTSAAADQIGTPTSSCAGSTPRELAASRAAQRATLGVIALITAIMSLLHAVFCFAIVPGDFSFAGRMYAFLYMFLGPFAWGAPAIGVATLVTICFAVSLSRSAPFRLLAVVAVLGWLLSGCTMVAMFST